MQIDPGSGQLVAWLNNLPGGWTPAGSDGGIIADGAGTGDVFFADSAYQCHPRPLDALNATSNLVFNSER